MLLAVGTFFLTNCAPLTPIEPVFYNPSSHASFGLRKFSYIGAGVLLESLACLTKCGHVIPSIQKECQLSSKICHQAALYFFTAAFRETSYESSYSSWNQNKDLLSQISTTTQEEKELLTFLKNRWLAKSIGFSTFLVDWVLPCFELTMQIHPETTLSYARSPQIYLPKAYKKQMETWKKSLPHPQDYPLLLTRHSNISNYLPNYISIPANESIEKTLEKQKSKISSTHILDMTDFFCADDSDPRKWIQRWAAVADSLYKTCQKQHIPLSSVCCIQRLSQKDLGGIRILQLPNSSKKTMKKHEQFLLMWISTFALSANRIELDRNTQFSRSSKAHTPTTSLDRTSPRMTKAELSTFFSSFPITKKANLQPNQFMFQGAIKIITGLLEAISESQWNKIMQSPVSAELVQLSFEQIQSLLRVCGTPIPFFQATIYIEQIYNHLTTLLEIFSPFTLEDFSLAYKKSLSFIPHSLSSYTTCGIHSSGMANLTGILKAVEKSIESPPYIIYGENTYYEIIHAANLTSVKACHAQEATTTDWEKVNLLLVQFQPVWKGLGNQIQEYRIEQIEKMILKALDARKGKPFTIALDCTIDFINSTLVMNLLKTFKIDIKKGRINFIGYKSGLKFDLFGMDNYCGAPLYMIHNKNPLWNSFDFLVTDPALQTDRLSLNWFCLAYKKAAFELDLYRKQIFDLTRSLLKKAPIGLYNPKASYQIIPVASNAYPSFIDITITGSFHKIKAALVGIHLTFQCLQKKLPLFYRISFGLYHTNLIMLFGKDSSTIRLTLGLDPMQVETLENSFKAIDALN